MTTDVDLWLELGAKFTVLVSILTIIYFCGFTAWRIARFQNHPWNFWGNVFTSRREIAHTPTLMPFTLTLKEDTLNDSDQVTFHLTCKVRPEAVKFLWAVDAGSLFKLINSHSWEAIKELKIDESVSPNHTNFSWHSVEELHVRTESDGSFEGDLTIATPVGLDWRTLINQYKYPLAVFLLAPENSLVCNDPSTITGICAIVHVKNSIIPKPSTIHAQYIKLKNGQAHLLQSLYVMDNGPLDDEESDASPTDAGVRNQPFADVCCSVCQVLPVSRAIIPCRHLCLCARCFTKVELCPICRGFISCYFKTRDESYMNDILDSS